MRLYEASGKVQRSIVDWGERPTSLWTLGRRQQEAPKVPELT